MCLNREQGDQQRGEKKANESYNAHFASYLDIVVKTIFHAEAECLAIGQTFCLYRRGYFFNIRIPIGRF